MSQVYPRVCARCGAVISPNQRFCVRCGMTIDELPGVAGMTDGAGGGGNPSSLPPPLPPMGMQAPQGAAPAPSPQFPPAQSVPSVSGMPSVSQPIGQPSSLHGIASQRQPALPSHAYASGGGAPQAPMHPMQPMQPMHSVQAPQAPGSQAQVGQWAGQPSQHVQSANLAQSAPPSAPFHGQPTPPPSYPQAHPNAFHAPSAPSGPALPPSHVPAPHVQPPPLPVHHALPPAPAAHAVGSLGRRAAHMGLRLLLKKPLVTAIALVVLASGSVGAALYAYHASAPTSFVIATDRGNNQVDRIDLATRKITVLLSNKVLPGFPDSIIFISDTRVLMDFPNSGEIGIGDIQQGTYKSVRTNLGGALRDMALRPDNSGVLISTGDTILEFHIDTQNISTFATNPGGAQGLSFDSNGALFVADGGNVIQLDPASGKQLKTFTLPGASDGMAYDGHHHLLDIAIGSSIMTLNPQTGVTSLLIDGINTPDGLAIDRQGNLFIASLLGVLELNTSNQLLLIGTNTAGITWDDVAPLSGAGAASY